MIVISVYRNWVGGLRGRGGYVALNTLNVNIDKYEQRQCNQLAETVPIQCGSVGRTSLPHLLLFTPLVLFAYL